jgi:signal recognition particle receptor subunit beta
MALINHRAHEVHFKIVYYGPGLGGKTTNVKMLHERLPSDRRGKLVSIATEQERTLFFDFLPIDLGQVNGFTTRFHLYTVPGQIYYKRSRRAVLQGVDGIVFVADSHPHREPDNLESLEDMANLLTSTGMTDSQIARIPRVIQYNKRDVPGALPVERMRATLNPDGVPEFEAVAVEGRGVAETMKTISKAVLARLVGATAAPPPAQPRERTTSLPAPSPARPLGPPVAVRPGSPAATRPIAPPMPVRVVPPAAAVTPTPSRPVVPPAPLRASVPVIPVRTVVPQAPATVPAGGHPNTAGSAVELTPPAPPIAPSHERTAPPELEPMTSSYPPVHPLARPAAAFRTRTRTRPARRP